MSQIFDAPQALVPPCNDMERAIEERNICTVDQLSGWEHLARKLETELTQARADIEERDKAIAQMRTWDGMMSLFDEFYPPDIFTGVSDDPGPRLIVAVRELDKLRAQLAQEGERDEESRDSVK